jgi:hypothetical protein
VERNHAKSGSASPSNSTCPAHAHLRLAHLRLP